VALGHRGVGAVAHVGEEAAEIGQRLGAGVDVAGAFGVDEEQMVAAGRPAMSTYLRSSIVPSVPSRNSRPSPQVGRPSGVNQSTRMKPEASPPQQDLAVVLEGGTSGRPRLAALAAISASAVPVKNRNWSIWCEAMSVRMPPKASGRRTIRRPDRAVQPVRAQAGGLDHPADRALGHQARGSLAGAHHEALGKADREDPARLARHRLDRGHLVER
jgi:hypothetical protein